MVGRIPGWHLALARYWHAHPDSQCAPRLSSLEPPLACSESQTNLISTSTRNLSLHRSFVCVVSTVLLLFGHSCQLDTQSTAQHSTARARAHTHTQTHKHTPHIGATAVLYQGTLRERRCTLQGRDNQGALTASKAYTCTHLNECTRPAEFHASHHTCRCQSTTPH